VTLRRVVAILLLGGFAESIASFLSWLISASWRLHDVETLRACLLAGVAFAVEAGLIYLALRGFGSLLEHRGSQESPAIVGEPAFDERDPTVPLEEIDAGTEAAAWPREGGGDGRGPEYC